MVKKTITYTDFNGVDRTEDFYFRFSEAEIMEMEYSIDGGMAEYLTKISNEKDLPKLIQIFKDLILKTYGVKSPDGKRFEKSDKISTDFSHTEAYSKLFMELAMNTDSAIEFCNGIIPNKKQPQDHNLKVVE